jgi:alkanesulfonate monooxygenase SsuD/methylene tetrahydromethanopterin reductase-like flavin-dependent oxidoreductase (luciferase family)
MVNVIVQIYPVVPAANEEERAALRPIGRNRERFQQALETANEVVKACDELGVWGVSCIEHHFHSEGYEVGPNPGIMNAYWAAITKNVRVGQLGYVMSAQNPIRVAEDIALLDHLTKGRCFVGFARGYQSRWTNVLGQHLGTRATRSPSGVELNPAAPAVVGKPGEAERARADDEVNRRIFEEEVEIVLKAWSEESIAYKGSAWQIPYPEAGIDDWQMAQLGITQRLGAHDEAGSDGIVRQLSVVPGLYTQPHPPIFVGISQSPESADYCARMDFIPGYFAPAKGVKVLGERYVEASRAAGRNYVLGQNQAVIRWPRIAGSREQAERDVMAYDADIFRNFYGPIAGRHLPEDRVLQSIHESGLWSIGTADQVRDELVAEWREMPAEYVILIYHEGQMPRDVVVRNLEQFMTHVKPALDEVTDYSEAKQVAAG